MRVRTHCGRARRSRRQGLRSEGGFSLVEMLVAMAVFLTIAVALAGTLTAAVASHEISRQRTQAEQVARDQVETIRRLPYDQVGLPSGNPPGVVQPTRSVSVSGLQASLTTQIAYVNDPNPGGFVTAANYKKVEVTVQRNGDNLRLARSVTYVTPPQRAAFGGINNAIINLQVVDFALGSGVPAAGITLSTGPSATRNDVTDTTGRVTFPALTANPTSGSQAFYDLSVNLAGYRTLSDDVSPAAPAHVSLAPGQTFATALRIYRPATIYVVLQNASGTPYTGASTVTVGSSRGTQTFNVTGSTLTVTTINGEQVVPGLQYTIGARGTGTLFAPAQTRLVPSNYPSDLTSTYTLRYGSYASTGTLRVKVRSGGSDVSGASVVVSGGPVPVYLYGVTDQNGKVSFVVPAGSGYAATAWTPTEQGTTSGQTATANQTTDVNVSIVSGG